MRQPREVANPTLVKALLAKRARPLILSTTYHRNKRRGRPPLGAEAALVELTKRRITSLLHARELIGVEGGGYEPQGAPMPRAHHTGSCAPKTRL